MNLETAVETADDIPSPMTQIDRDLK